MRGTRAVINVIAAVFTSVAAAVAQAQAPAGVGFPVTVELSGADVKPVPFSLRAGEFVRFAASAPDTVVSIAALTAAGQRFAASTSVAGTGGSTEIAIYSAEGGAYRLDLRVPRREAIKRSITVSVMAQATASQKERTDAEGWSAYMHALEVENRTPAAGSDAIQAAYSDAAHLAESAGDGVLQRLVAVARCRPLLNAGEWKKANAQAESDLPMTQSSKDARAEAALLYVSAVAKLQMEDSLGAIPLFQRALLLQRAARQLYETSLTLNNLAIAQRLAGQCREALDGIEEAVKIRHLMQDKQGEAYSDFELANVRLCLSDSQHALETYAEVLPIWRELGNRRNEAMAFNNRGVIYAGLGEWQSAAEANREALSIRTQLKDQPGIAESLVNIGQLDLATHDFAKAQQDFRRALDLAMEGRLRRAEGYARMGLGEAMLRLSADRAQVDAMLSDSVRVLAELGDRDGEALSWQAMSEYHRAGRQYPQAVEDCDHALVLLRETGDLTAESLLLFDLARLYKDQNQPERALATVNQAIERIEQSRASLSAADLRAAWLAAKREAFDLKISLLRALAGKDSGAAEHEAFATSEQAHARVILDSIRESKSDIEEALPEPLQIERSKLEAQLNAAATRMDGLAGSDKSALLAARQRVEALLQSRRQLEDRIRLAAPRYASVSLPRPVSVDEVQKEALDAQTALIEYYIGEDRGYAWVVTPGSLRAFELPARAVIERQVREFQAAIEARNLKRPEESLTLRNERWRKTDVEVARLSKLLGAALLAPADAEIKAHRRIAIVPDGPLHLLPFAALPQLQAANETVLLPSASVLVEMRRERRGALPARALVIADPVYSANDARVARPAKSAAGPGLTRLPWSRQEASAVAALAPGPAPERLLDFAASKQDLRKEDLTRFGVVHIATHALLDAAHPDLSGIALSLVDRNGRPQDGFLRLREIYNLRLNARLVVLSSCRSAVGPSLGGEGLLGLSRGFLYAGSGSVVATLWSVDDYATAQFMARFYRALWREHLAPAAALRKAGEWMAAQPRWHSPYYWAAFTLTGEWR